MIGAAAIAVRGRSRACPAGGRGRGRPGGRRRTDGRPPAVPEHEGAAAAAATGTRVPAELRERSVYAPRGTHCARILLIER